MNTDLRGKVMNIKLSMVHTFHQNETSFDMISWVNPSNTFQIIVDGLGIYIGLFNYLFSVRQLLKDIIGKWGGI